MKTLDFASCHREALIFVQVIVSFPARDEILVFIFQGPVKTSFFPPNLQQLLDDLIMFPLEIYKSFEMSVRRMKIRVLGWGWVMEANRNFCAQSKLCCITVKGWPFFFFFSGFPLNKAQMAMFNISYTLCLNCSSRNKN